MVLPPSSNFILFSLVSITSCCLKELPYLFYPQKATEGLNNLDCWEKFYGVLSEISEIESLNVLALFYSINCATL
jgi:hypothetical protein